MHSTRIAAILVSLEMVATILAAECPAEDKKPADKASAVKLQILDHAGYEKLIAGHKGKVVVVDCWSTWCDPCIKEFPGLVKLHKKYSAKKVACVSLSVDFDGAGKPESQLGPVLEFLQKQGATFDNVMAADPDDVYKQLEIPAPPAVLVYDTQGKLAKMFHVSTTKRDFTYDDVGQFVDELLKAKP